MSGSKGTPEQIVSGGLITVDEAAAFLGIGRTKLYALMGNGQLQFVRIDGVRRIPRQGLIEFAATHLTGGSGQKES